MGGLVARLAAALAVHLQQGGRVGEGGPEVAGRQELLQPPGVARHPVAAQHLPLAGLALALTRTM